MGSLHGPEPGRPRSGRPVKVRVYLGKDFIGPGEPMAIEFEPFGGAVPAGGVYVG